MTELERMLAEIREIRSAQARLAERLAALNEDLDEPRRSFENFPLAMLAIGRIGR
jgi:hypothetical protein